MLRRILFLLLVLALFAGCVAAPVRADTGSDDPCKPKHSKNGKAKKKVEDPCENIPEVPVALFYPVSAGVLVAIVLYTNRRRRSWTAEVR